MHNRNNSETRRQQLIKQMRTTLNDLENPNFFTNNETLTFTIADMDFEFDKEQLERLEKI